MPTPETIAEALRVIYVDTIGWSKIPDPRNIGAIWRSPEGKATYKLPDPIKDFAEFGRLVVWALSHKILISHWNKEEVTLRELTTFREFYNDNGNPQTAFIIALAAAIQARKEG